MKNIYFLLLFCTLVLNACNAPAVTQPSAITSTLTPINIVTPTLSVETTQTPKLLNFSPVIYGQNFGSGTFLLLGGVQDGAWLGPDTVAAQIQDGMVFDIYSTDSRLQMIGHVSGPDPICDTYFVDADENISVSGMIGVAQGWDVTQRKMEELSSDNDFYRQVVMDWLIEQGISNPIVENLHVSRVDIEGDGVDEVFLSASHFNDGSGHMSEYGDYTVILMRKVNGDDAVTLDLVREIHSSQEPEMTFPIKYSLTDFIDLDQDGNLEVIIEINRWEGFGAAVYQINGSDRVQVLQVFCGE